MIMQQVAYEVCCFDNAKELHHAVAGWYEKTYAANLALALSVLAHYWLPRRGARQSGRISGKGRRASAQQRRVREAAGFFGEALQLDGEAGLHTSAFRRAAGSGNWVRHISDWDDSWKAGNT